MLWNLTKNAIKFSSTPNGTITIRSRDRDDEHLPVASSWLVIEVSDEGIGIAPELLPHVFSMFEQGGSSTRSKFGGLGLGLTISRSIVEQHGGDLRAFIAGPGKGTTLTMELPVAGRAVCPRCLSSRVGRGLAEPPPSQDSHGRG